MQLLILTLVPALLLGCAPQAESQDKYAGDADIPEPGNFVDPDFAEHDGGTATGDIIVLNGAVVNEQGEPLSGAIVYVHQTDVQGRYLFQAERDDAVDPHFQYEGWIRADERGRFVLRTIAPGSYVRSESAVPHIHIQARHGDIRSYYKSLNFPQYPPRNGDMSYSDRTDKWGLVVDLKESSESGVTYTGEFQLVCF